MTFSILKQKLENILKSKQNNVHHFFHVSADMQIHSSTWLSEMQIPEILMITDTFWWDDNQRYKRSNSRKYI